MPDPFLACIIEGLTKKGSKNPRLQEVEDMYTRNLNFAIRDGRPDPGAHAMAQTLAMMQNEKFQKLNNMRMQLQLVARTKDQFARADKIKLMNFMGVDPGKGIGGKIGAVRKGILEVDPRVSGEQNVYGAQETKRTQYFALMGDAIQDFMKNWRGVRDLPSASMRNIVRELFGIDSGDKRAKALAEGYVRIQKASIADLKRVGAMVHELADFHLPQWQSTVKMLKIGVNQWVADHMNWIDWNKTVFPDGTLIPVADRARVLEESFWKIVGHGVTGNETRFSGFAQGKAMGNMLESERFLHYEDVDAWWGMHEKYMDGNVVDTLARHIDRRATQVGTMQVLGPNPTAGIATIDAIARTEAQKAARKAKPGSADERALDELKKSDSRFHIMSDAILHKHPEDHNKIASFVSTSTNLATAALLKSAVFISVASDMMNTLAIRFAQNQSLVGFMGSYIRTMFPGGARKNALLMAQAGFVSRELISNNYIAARVGMGTQYGRPVSQQISETMMRLTLLQRHTIAIRAANQQELMGALWRERGLKLADTRTVKTMLMQAGITEKEWDTVRNNIKPWEPMKGAQFMRPLDILNLKHANKDDMYGKFQAMIVNQSQMMVPYTTAEARAVITRGLRPDSVMGAYLHSAGMYHGYPVTMAMMVGRMIAGGPDIGVSRMKLAAAMGLGSIVAGAAGVQMRDMALGREPQSLDDPNFWLRAFLASISAPVLGDLLTAGLSTDPARAVGGLAAGPLGAEVGDLVGIVMTPFGWAGIGDRDQPVQTMLRKSVDAVERYITPATFYTYLPMERAFFDNLRSWVDPQGTARARRSQVSLQKQKYGRGFWSPPGGGIESLLP